MGVLHAACITWCMYGSSSSAAAQRCFCARVRHQAAVQMHRAAILVPELPKYSAIRLGAPSSKRRAVQQARLCTHPQRIRRITLCALLGTSAIIRIPLPQVIDTPSAAHHGRGRCLVHGCSWHHRRMRHINSHEESGGPPLLALAQPPRCARSGSSPSPPPARPGQLRRPARARPSCGPGRARRRCSAAAAPPARPPPHWPASARGQPSPAPPGCESGGRRAPRPPPACARHRCARASTAT
jgi:hypothetical protein